MGPCPGHWFLGGQLCRQNPEGAGQGYQDPLEHLRDQATVEVQHPSLGCDRTDPTKEYLKAMREGKNPSPPKKIKRLVCRIRINPNDPDVNPEDMVWFKWHVSNILPKVAGKADWSQCMRLYETPSTATVLYSDPPIKSVPAGSEAMCCFAVENGYSRWLLEHEMEKAGQIPEGKKFMDMVDLGTRMFSNSGNPDHKARFPTLHTGIAEPGIDQKFGLVSLAGRTRFNELTKLIQKAPEAASSQGGRTCRPENDASRFEAACQEGEE